MADYSEAMDYYVDPSRVFVGQNSQSAIVLHGTGGDPSQTAQQLGDYFRTNSLLTSSHFGIDRQGVICQYVALSDGAAANCCLEAGYDPFWNEFNGDNLNIHSISIEHVNDSANSLPLSPAQQDASFKLIAWLCARYHLTFDQIKTHASIAPSSRARCPGSAYPLAALQTYLSGGQNVNLYSPNSADFNSYFTVDPNGNWLCKQTSVVIIGGNKGLFSQLSIDGNTLPVIGLPRTSELYQHDGDGYSWSVQFFERGVIVYDPAFKRDRQPGLGASYIGKYEQLMALDPNYQLVGKNTR